MIVYLYFVFFMTKGFAYNMIFIEPFQPSNNNTMKKILYITIALFMGLISCNSGSNETTAVTDSTSVHADSASIHDSASIYKDSSHSAMNMAMGDSLPVIPAGAKVIF